MFRKRNIVCAVELGTSKICALIGEASANGGVSAVLGQGIVPSNGAVVKGEISDMDKAVKALNKALEDADRSSGGELINCRLLTLLVSGCGIESRQGVGIVTVKNPDGIVTEAERDEANENAKIIDVGVDREIINTSTSYFLLDNRRVGNPLRQSGRRLEACNHIIHAVSSRIANFRDAVIDAGIENIRIEPVFSPLAAGIGIVDDIEKENGSLLIDLGAGATEYLVYFDRGVCASGVLQLGMEHVANDLAIAFNLHIDSCRKIIGNSMLSQALANGKTELEFSGPGGRMRSIPISAMEAVIDARLREIFELIRSKLEEKKAPKILGAGGILTGGGAEYFRSKELFRDVFELSCRIGAPADAGGAVSDLAAPRFSAVWGALKVAAFFQQNFGPVSEGYFARMMNRFSRVLESVNR